jgi:subtilisin family serine protease
VAVLDTGIYYKHRELLGRVIWCANTVGRVTYTGTDLDKCIDRNGHGTHVAGIIAAAIDNVGNAGVSPNVSIYAIKVLNDGGIGFYSDIAEGIILAVKGPNGVPGTEDDAKILSMSLGGSSDSNVLRDAVNRAYSNGAIIVAAAGNSGDGDPTTDNIVYPARYDNVIAVGAIDQNYNIPT